MSNEELESVKADDDSWLKLMREKAEEIKEGRKLEGNLNFHIPDNRSVRSVRSEKTQSRITRLPTHLKNLVTRQKGN